MRPRSTTRCSKRTVPFVADKDRQQWRAVEDRGTQDGRYEHPTRRSRNQAPVANLGARASRPRSQEASRGGECAAIPCVAPRRWLRGRRGRAARRVRGGTGLRRSSRGIPGSAGRRSTGWDGAAGRRRHFRCGARRVQAASLRGFAFAGRRHRFRYRVRCDRAAMIRGCGERHRRHFRHGRRHGRVAPLRGFAGRRHRFRYDARRDRAAMLAGDGGRRHCSRSALRKAGGGRSSTARCRSCPQGVGPRFRVRNLPWLPARVLRSSFSARSTRATM